MHVGLPDAGYRWIEAQPKPNAGTSAQQAQLDDPKQHELTVTVPQPARTAVY